MIFTNPVRSARTVLWWVAVVACTVSAAAVADDDLDRQLLESLEGRHKPDSPVTLVKRLLDNTQSARERLAAGQLGEQTQSIQQQILDDLDALLEQTESAPPPSRPSPPAGDSQSQPSAADRPEPDPPGGEASADSAGGPGGEPSDDPNAPSRESVERTTAAVEPDAAREQRLGLATAAWGHLPPKVREQMRSAFSETFLPEYDELVRRYYEALATRRGQSGTPTNRRAPSPVEILPD